MAACIRPDLTGPVVLAGAPVSYWGGVRGQNPMRYTGGLLGGSWLARFISDLGGGTFDGAWLISNFDSLNPANTVWTKPYTVWARPENEEQRYLEFEKWWGAFVHLRGEELPEGWPEALRMRRHHALEQLIVRGTAQRLVGRHSSSLVFVDRDVNSTQAPDGRDQLLL